MSAPQASPEVVRWFTLILSIACVFVVVVSGGSLIEAERTGVVDRPLNIGAPMFKEQVTRAAAPGKFNDGIAYLVLDITLCSIVAVVSFSFYRRLSE